MRDSVMMLHVTRQPICRRTEILAPVGNSKTTPRLQNKHESCRSALLASTRYVFCFITGYQNTLYRGTVAQVRKDGSSETDGMLSYAAIIDIRVAISYLDRILTYEAVV